MQSSLLFSSLGFWGKAESWWSKAKCPRSFAQNQCYKRASGQKQWRSEKSY